MICTDKFYAIIQIVITISTLLDRVLMVWYIFITIKERRDFYEKPDSS